MLIGDGLVSLIWLLNTVIGNNGGMLHMIFLRTAQASALLVLLEIVFEVMAMTSYGTRVQVFNSWFGWGVPQLSLLQWLLMVAPLLVL